MKRFGFVLFSCLFVLIFGTSVARGQGGPGVHIGIAGGADFPVSDQKDVFKTGWSGTLLIPINFGTSPIGIRLDGSYHELKVKDDVFVPNGGSGRVRIIDGTADLTIGPHTGTVQPYFLGGVGAYDMRFRGQDITTGNAFSDTTTRFGWNAGGGIAFPLGDNSGSRFFIEARYTSVSTNGNRFSDSVKTGGSRFTFVPVSAGFVF
jgi:opacity protein-like surface antigen